MTRTPGRGDITHHGVSRRHCLVERYGDLGVDDELVQFLGDLGGDLFDRLAGDHDALADQRIRDAGVRRNRDPVLQ